MVRYPRRRRIHTTDDGLIDSDVRSVVIAPDGTPWFGTWSSGVSRFDGETWAAYATDDSLAHNLVRAIAAAPDGTLWFGTHDGITRFQDPAELAAGGKAWMTYTSAECGVHLSECGLEDDTILSIAVAPDGALWFGTEYGGVYRFDGKEWIAYTFAASPTGQVVLVGKSIGAIAVAPDGALWFGAMGGVYRFTGEIGRSNAHYDAWTIYTTGDGLVSGWIRSIAVAPDGALWFGSAVVVPRGGGVSRFDGKTWITYTVKAHMGISVKREM